MIGKMTRLNFARKATFLKVLLLSTKLYLHFKIASDNYLCEIITNVAIVQEICPIFNNYIEKQSIFDLYINKPYYNVIQNMVT